MNPELAAALARLDRALAGLESAAERRLDPDVRRSDLETELQVMGDDRARLATELDSAAARVARFETASDHLSLRIDAAVAAIRTTLDAEAVD